MEKKNYAIEKGETLFAKDHKDGAKISKYTTIKGINYPHVELKTETIKTYLVDYLKKITLSDKFDEVQGYDVYINIQDKKLRVGVLPTAKYPVLLTPLFSSFLVTLRMTPEEEYTGDSLYAFCPPKV